MNYYQINDAIINISNQYDYINYINQQKNVINVTEIYNNVALSLPSSIINLLFIGITLIILYYYIFPVWVEYFEQWFEYGDLIFKAGLIFISMSLLYLTYFTYPKSKFYILLFSYIILIILLYRGSKWLLKRKR